MNMGPKWSLGGSQIRSNSQKLHQKAQSSNNQFFKTALLNVSFPFLRISASPGGSKEVLKSTKTNEMVLKVVVFLDGLQEALVVYTKMYKK